MFLFDRFCASIVPTTELVEASPCTPAAASEWVFASRRSRPIIICRTMAPAEWSVAEDPSTARTIVRVLLFTV